MTNEERPDRRALLGLGAAAAGAVLVGGRAAAQDGGGNAVPNLYPSWNARQFQQIQANENAHVTAVVALIQKKGGTPRPRPNFKNLTSPNLKSFVAASYAQEQTGAGANAGVANIIFDKEVLMAAASIATIEARHCGYLNMIVNRTNGTNVFGQEQNFERPLTQDEVRNLVAPFLQDLNGGPPAAFTLTPSLVNDIAILNFALILEYLERDFYNINVPRFFPA